MDNVMSYAKLFQYNQNEIVILTIKIITELLRQRFFLVYADIANLVVNNLNYNLKLFEPSEFNNFNSLDSDTQEDLQKTVNTLLEIAHKSLDILLKNQQVTSMEMCISPPDFFDDFGSSQQRKNTLSLMQTLTVFCLKARTDLPADNDFVNLDNNHGDQNTQNNSQETLRKNQPYRGDKDQEQEQDQPTLNIATNFHRSKKPTLSVVKNDIQDDHDGYDDSNNHTDEPVENHNKPISNNVVSLTDFRKTHAKPSTANSLNITNVTKIKPVNVYTMDSHTSESDFDDPDFDPPTAA